MRPTKTHAHELLLHARCIARPTLVFCLIRIVADADATKASSFDASAILTE